MFYINLFFFFIKSKLNYNNDCKVSYKIKKKFSRNFVILKAAFKHKIPKHILKKNQTKLIIKISYDNVRYNLDSISNSDLNKLFLFKNKIITIKNYSFFLPGHLYRVKCQLPILYNFNNFNNF